MIVDRGAECEALDQLIADVLAGESRVLVLRGEAGVGKSTLLGYLSERANDAHIVRAVGVESEMELPYSGLHQLCAPMLDHLEQLPVPQRDALETVFGRRAAAAPDRFLVGLAALTLLADVAERQPLVCIVDDAQWLDLASAQILAFVARRLLAERIALVCGARTGIGDNVLAGLPELSVEGLGERDARTLLLQNVYAPLDAAVRDRIIAESRGNPLAILELPRTWTAADLAGGFGLPDSGPVAGEIERSYVRRLGELPPKTQLLVLAAAAEPLGDPSLLQRAVDVLDLDWAAVDPAVDAGLLHLHRRVEFAHPLVRSAAYHAATAADRHLVHRALAEATDAQIDPDRRAWHRARATPGPDEEVAAELERSAARAQSRGGIAAAAAFLERAAALTRDPTTRADRALAAAQASLKAGAFDAALSLVSAAEACPLNEGQRALIDFVRAQIAFASGSSRDVSTLLLNAARRLEPFDPDLGRETLLLAWQAAVVAGQFARADVLLEICRAIRALPPRKGGPLPLDLLLDGLALLTTDGRAAAVPTLQRAARALADLPVEDVLRWGLVAGGASAAVWDDEAQRAICARQAQIYRDAGALAELPLELNAMSQDAAWCGDFTGAAALLSELESVAMATGSRFAPYAATRLAALRGRETEAAALIASSIDEAAAGQGLAAIQANWAAAVLYNGLARYEEAASAASQATSNTFEPWSSMWALPELIEASVRIGETEVARESLERLAETTQPAGTDFACGIEARSRALLSSGEDADALYREAIDRFGRTRLRPELARAHLLYGEWLRREGRRLDARVQLRMATDMFDAIGMEAFAERARRELLATGERARKRVAETRDQLTPQEEQIARFARDGLSNSEIGAMLFLSPRTVEWHLRKVFNKLGINSRNALLKALPEPNEEGTAA